MNDLEHDVSDALDRRVRDLHDRPLSLDAVRGRATRIRRRRRLAAAGGAIAIAAALTPVALVATGGNDRAATPPVATQTPASTAVPVPAETQPAYVLDRTVHLADGSTVRLPRAYDRVAVVGDEVLGTYYDQRDGGSFLDTIVDGEVSESVPVQSNDVAAAPGGAGVAYVDDDRHLVLRWPGGSADLGEVPTDALPRAVVSDGSCDDGGCVVYLDRPEGGPVQTAPGEDGYEALPVAAVSVEGAGPGVAVLTTDLTPELSPCTGLLDVDAADLAFRATCDVAFSTPSPDGRLVTGFAPAAEGPGSTWVAVYDRSGAEVTRYDAAPGDLAVEAVWEDDQHLLVLEFRDGTTWGLLRLDVEAGELDADRITDLGVTAPGQPMDASPIQLLS